MQPRDMYVNQNASLLDQQQYLQGLQNHQQVLFGESLGYNNQLINTSGGVNSSAYKFQQDCDFVGSPTVTTNSERSEVTEASSGDFCFQTRLPEFQPPQLFPQRQQQLQQQQKFLNPGSMFSMGLGSQQLDIPRYTTPVTANTRGNMGPQFPNQVMYQARPPSDQSHRSLMQLSDYNSHFLKNQYDLSSAHVQGSGISDSGILLMGNSQKCDTSLKESPFQQKDTELSQGLVPLDPLEEKILFSMEDSSISEIASGVFDDVNLSSSFPSMQSGSWSALMQTAVAEASSSDTGLQEEFSSLTYQNMELPADINDISNFLDSDKQLPGCANNNTLQGSGGFPGFQLPYNQLRSCLFQDESTPDSTQRSSNLTSHWVDCNPQQKILRGNQQMQSGVSFDNLSTNLQPSGMFDQLPSSTARSSASHLGGMPSFDTSQGGKWENVPGHLRKAHFVQQNEPATVYASSQVPTINPFVASQPDNAAFRGVQLNTGLGGHTSNHTRLPQPGTNRQFNVWMDLPIRQHISDREPLKAPLISTSPIEVAGSHATAWKKTEQMPSSSYDMPQRVGLPQERGAASKDVNKPQGEINMDFSTNSKLYAQKDGLKVPMSSTSQLKSFVFDDTKMVQYGSNGLASSVEHSHLNLPASKPLDTVNKNAETITPEKPKLTRRKQLAWHKEVSNASQKDHTTSVAEQEWATASKLLVEKAEYDRQSFEFALPLHRSKRRLVLTSQLMQQLFDPPPSFALSSAASSSYSTLSFCIARETLGNACSLAHKREHVLASSSSPLHEVEKLPEKNGRQHSEVAKTLTEKAKKLEESFDRLVKTMSMADISCEITDMERFSVINRFARFHSKSPADNNPLLLKPTPQRYIAVRPMPQNIPDGVQCLSL